MLQGRIGDEEAELAIELAVMCKQTRSLPRPGGLFDQDSLHVRWLKAGNYAIGKYEEKQLKDKKK